MHAGHARPPLPGRAEGRERGDEDRCARADAQAAPRGHGDPREEGVHVYRDYLTASTLTFFRRGESWCTRVGRLFFGVDANFFQTW